MFIRVSYFKKSALPVLPEIWLCKHARMKCPSKKGSFLFVTYRLYMVKTIRRMKILLCSFVVDEVYLKDDVLRQEYVLNEEGLMWRGSYNRQKEVMWKYGQFQKNMLESSFMLLLQLRRLPLIHCGDPIEVSRNLSAAVST